MAWERLFDGKKRVVFVEHGIQITEMWPGLWQCVVNQPRYRFTAQGNSPLIALDGALKDMIEFHKMMKENLELLDHVRKQCNENNPFSPQSSG